MTIKYSMESRRCAFAHSSNLMFSQRCDVPIGSETMSRIIGNDMDDVHDWKYYSYDPSDGTMCMDVCARVMNLIAQYYFGHDWPMDHVDFNQQEFHERLLSTVLEERSIGN